MMNAPNAPSQKQGIQSIERAFRMLDGFVRATGPLRLADIARAAGMTRNLAHAYLTSLVRVGALSKEGRGFYRLGETSIQIGLNALARMDLATVAKEFMQQLLNRTGESVGLFVWSEQGPIVVAKVDGHRLAPFQISIGTRAELSLTSTGRTFMAYLEPVHWKHLLKVEQEAMGSMGITEKKLEVSLKRIRANGIASRDIAMTPTIHPLFLSLAAPVFDHSGAIKAVLTMVGPPRTFDASPGGANSVALKHAVSRLSARLGFIGESAS